MGVYLNSRKPHDNYKELADTPYFVDKSYLLNELIPLVERPVDRSRTEETGCGRSNKYICVTRPRRFGKTVTANMVAAFFGKGKNSRQVFERLDISKRAHYDGQLNAHNVIYISFNEIPRNCSSYQKYIDRVQNRLLQDLRREFPDVEIEEEDAVWDALNNIYELSETVKFIFVLDEWDFIFHQDFITEEDKSAYNKFLSTLLKDQPYVEFVYMTGILPIAKYSSGSELNMFLEYTMATEELFSEAFGFTESEVDKLYSRYLERQPRPVVSREDLRLWYDGYHTHSGERVYNPRSVVASLTNNNLGNYWTSSGPYDEIFYYLEKNVDAVRDDLAMMISGIPVPAKIREYAATSMNLTTKDEIFSAMVVYGFLSYENGFVSIPNRELMERFDDMLQKEPSLGYIFQLAKASEALWKATLEGDTDTICRVLEYAHNTESPLLSYNQESDLTAVVNLAYLAARERYDVRREEKGGIGYVDFTFIPKDPKEDCLILELKVDSTPQQALCQICEKQYVLRFLPKLGEAPRYTGRILAIGISYDRKSKKHSCKFQVLREAI